MSDFTSIQNKGIIWEILIEQKLFEGIDQKHKYEIKDLFENTILMIENQGKGLSLIEKNKEVIKNMVLRLESFKPQPIISKREYTNEEIHKERQKTFETELKRKQTEFDGLSRKPPEKIDFSDKLDEKIGDKMDSLLAEAIAAREFQMNQVIQTHNPETASKWIVGGNNLNVGINGNEHQSNQEQPKNLKIGNETHIQENQIVILDKSKNNNHDKKMKVSFNEANNEIHNFSKDSPILTSKSEENLDIGSNLFKLLKTDSNQNQNRQNHTINTNVKPDIDKMILNEENPNVFKTMLQDMIDIKREIMTLKNEIKKLNDNITSNTTHI